MNIQDIAKIAGVSVATVSRVLNNKSDVSKKTKNKILEIINENNYIPNTMARNLVKNENNTIGLIIPDIKNLYFANMLNEIVDVLNDKGFNVIPGFSNENFRLQKRYTDLFLEQRVKAIIVVVTKNSSNNIDYFKDLAKKTKLILLDRRLEGKFNGIYFNSYDRTYSSIENMLKKGAKKIGIITGPLDLSTAKERFVAYKKALKKNMIKFDEKLVYNGDFTIESGYLLGKEIVKYDDIDALYISNNLMTLGFIKALKELNIDSERYQIATFEDNEITNFIDSHIEANEIPFKDLANECINMIEYVCNNDKQKILEIKI